MKRFAYDIFMIAVILILIIAGIYAAWGPVLPIQAAPTEPNVQELQGEIARLAPYEAFMKGTDVTIVYNGCEDLRAQLGLTP